MCLFYTYNGAIQPLGVICEHLSRRNNSRGLKDHNVPLLLLHHLYRHDDILFERHSRLGALFTQLRTLRLCFFPLHSPSRLIGRTGGRVLACGNILLHLDLRCVRGSYRAFQIEIQET